VTAAAFTAGSAPRRAIAACAFVALPVALALAVAALLDVPRATGLLVAMLVTGVAAWRWSRREGALGLWTAALLLSVVAGEMAALPLGGQSGRLLWADLVLAAGAGIALRRARGVVTIPAAPFIKVIGLFCVCGAVSLLAARDVLTGIAELKEWLVMAIAGAACLAWARDARRVRLLLGCVAIVGAGVALWMMFVVWRAPGGPLMTILMKQVDLPWGRTNDLAGRLILALPVALGLSGSAARRAPRAGWALAAVIVATGLALSASKGAILAFGIALLSALVVRPRPSRAVVGVALLLVAAGALVFIAGPLQEVLAYRTQASALDYSMAERTDLYALGWNAFAAQPLLGVGLNNFSVLAHSLRGIDTVPHNLTIGFLAELGLAGGVLSLALMATLLAAAHRACVRALDSRTASLALGLWIATVGFAVHNQFESTIYG
jgi:hypothetical protein